MPVVFEDFEKGQLNELGAHTFTREAIVEFAGEFDPQPFHLDEAAGKASILGSLSASGWHTGSVAMRLFCDHLLLDSACMGSPGIEELRWVKPVRPGDVLRLRAEILDLKSSRSRPDIGFVMLRLALRDASETEVMWYRTTVMFARRGQPMPAPRTPPEEFVSTGDLPEPEVDFASVPSTNGLLSGWLDDLVIGYRIETGSYRFTRDNIIRFARRFDPQAFHIGEEEAKKTFFGGLAASGWHTAGAAMSRLVATRNRWTAEAKRRGLADTPRGPSPGFRDMSWIKPVYAGDVISFSTTPIEKRPISRPGWGIAFHRNEGVNQRGEKIFEYTSSSLWPVRS